MRARVRVEVRVRFKVRVRVQVGARVRENARTRNRAIWGGLGAADTVWGQELLLEQGVPWPKTHYSCSGSRMQRWRVLC